MRTKKMSDSQVLELAFDVISRKGFDSFTLKDVAKVTKLSPAALIKRFKNKKNLALLARNTRWDNNLSSTLNNKEQTEIGLDGILELVRLIASSVDSERLGEHARWLGTESLSPKSRRKVADYFEVTRNTLKRHIQEAQEQKQISKDIDSGKLSMNLEAFIQGVIFQYIFLKKKRHISIHLEERVRFFLDSYQAQN